MKQKINFYSGYSNQFTLPYLIKTAEDEGFDISIFSKDTLPTCVTNDDVFIFSFLTVEAPLVHSIIKKIRKTFENKTPIIIGGGPHVDGNPQFALKTLDIDRAVCGYAGKNWVSKVLNGKSKIIRLSEPETLDDILPIPKKHLFRPPLEIRRGCNRNCSFCRTGSIKNILTRSKESILEYLKNNENRNFKRISYVIPSAFETSDDEFVKWLLAVSREKYKSVEYAIFPSEADPSTITHERVKIIKKYCSNKKITIGCQSASEKRLKLLKRGHTLEHVLEAASLCRQEGFIPLIDFIVGFPNETQDELLETQEFVSKINKKYAPRIQVHYFMPLPGTDLGRFKASLLPIWFQKWLNDEEKNGVIKGVWKIHYESSSKLLPYLQAED